MTLSESPRDFKGDFTWRFQAVPFPFQAGEFLAKNENRVALRVYSDSFSSPQFGPEPGGTAEFLWRTTSSEPVFEVLFRDWGSVVTLPWYVNPLGSFGSFSVGELLFNPLEA